MYSRIYPQYQEKLAVYTEMYKIQTAHAYPIEITTVVGVFAVCNMVIVLHCTK